MKFKKLMCLTAAVVLGGSMILGSSSAIAAPGEHLNWGHELNGSEPACPAGDQVINVVHKVINDMDSGTGGNDWAYDEYVRQIQVVDLGAGSFCATVKYQGNFETVAGKSPGCGDAGTCGTEAGTVGEGVIGTFQGGYTATIKGTLRTDPSERIKGSLGTFNYGVTPFNWLDAYFEAGWNFEYKWWGWVYHAGNNGGWVNSASGNSGDITGN